MLENAVKDYGFDERVLAIANEQIANLNNDLTVQFNDVDNQLMMIAGRVDSLDNRMLALENGLIDINEILHRQLAVQDDINVSLGDIEHRISTLEAPSSGADQLGTSTAFLLTKEGYLKLGNNIAGSALGATEAPKALSNSSTTPVVAVVELAALSDDIPAFVVNQAGEGDVADFQAGGVSIVNIAQDGKVAVVGEMQVDGRLLVCSGGACGANLENAVDETMGDLGVEGKVVAGAFEGYCPDGYIWVPGSAKYGSMPGFCVMQTEAKVNFGGVDTAPWTNISQGEAMVACQSQGEGYHLISENEWLTIADNLTKVAANDINPDLAGLQLATSSDPTLATSTVDQKLTNDNIIGNFTGGVGEWTDETITRAGLITPVSNDWQEYYNITDYQGYRIAPPYYYSSANGIGRILTGDNSSNLRGFIRGEGGIYSLNLSYSPDTATSTIGFRCAK
jgi:hypothetical protein